jgi:small conductance mechanosensitive channel
MDEQLQMLEHAKRTAIDLAMQFGPKVLVAVIIIIVGFMVGRSAARMAGRGLAKVRVDRPLRELLTRTVHVLVLGLFVVMALQNLGVQLLPLIAGVGLAGAGFALAMQGVLGNLIAGLTIIFTHPFRVGEYISIVGVEGEVDTVELFSTTLRHPDRSLVVIPNRRIVGEILHNYGSVRQLNIVVGVAYDTDLSHALSVIGETLRSNPRVLADPAPVISVSVLGNSSVEISVSPWTVVGDCIPAQSEINKAILEAFRGRGIRIPFPQREVRILQAATNQDGDGGRSARLASSP